jgi:hypothetical protein
MTIRVLLQRQTPLSSYTCIAITWSLESCEGFISNQITSYGSHMPSCQVVSLVNIAHLTMSHRLTHIYSPCPIMLQIQPLFITNVMYARFYGICSSIEKWDTIESTEVPPSGHSSHAGEERWMDMMIESFTNQGENSLDCRHIGIKFYQKECECKIVNLFAYTPSCASRRLIKRHDTFF